MKTKAVTDEFIRRVTRKLREGRGIRYTLPGKGLIHIDRPLPFLLVYRHPPGRKDRYTNQLVRSEASFLIVSGDQSGDLQKLVRAITRTLSDMNGAFLIIEVWKGTGDFATDEESAGQNHASHTGSIPAKAGRDSGREHTDVRSSGAEPPSEKKGSRSKPVKAGTHPASGDFGQASSKHVSPRPAAPVFRLMGPAEVSFSSVKYLKNFLEDMRLGVLPVTAVLLPGKKRHPAGMPPLMQADELKAMEALLIGVEICPFYINPDTGESFPLMFRKLGEGFSRAVKKTIYEFVRIQTKVSLKHYQMLGRRTVNRLTWEIDENLAAINDSFRFLLLVTPINIAESYERFRKNRFERVPEFHYRLMPVDPDFLKRELYNIPIEEVEDPALERLFRDKRSELDKQLSLLGDRGKNDFMLGSMQLYGRIDASLLRIAEGLLASIPPARDSKDQMAARLISPEEFAAMARREIGYYREQYPEINSEVHVQDDIAGLIVASGNLYIGTDARIERNRAEALIQHEVGTHILTYYNGRAQPLKQLYCGVPGYEELQEGLAVLSEYLVGGLTATRLRLLAARVVAVHSMIQGVDFIETFRILHNHHRLDETEAFTTTMRVYRGGGLTKDAIYLKGLVRLLDWLGNGHSLEPLLIGKIHEEYIPLMQELMYRKVLRPVPIRPRYLSNSEAQARLEELKSGKSVMNLV